MMGGGNTLSGADQRWLSVPCDNVQMDDGEDAGSVHKSGGGLGSGKRDWH